MSFSFFTKQSAGETVLLLDVGSASVGAAHAVMGASGVPRIIAATRADIPFQETLSAAHFVSAMNRALFIALKALKAECTRKGVLFVPQRVFCGLSSPWFILKARRIAITRAEPFEVTERLLDAVFDEDIETLKNELQKTLPLKDIAVIEKKVFQVKLNGYEVKDPYGRKTAKLEALGAVSVSSRRAMESIRRAVNSIFHAPTIHFSSFPLAAFSAIRDLFPHEQNFLFLDITGEATDVSRIERDMLVGTVSFPRGKNFFIREIANKRGAPHEEAASIFGMFLRNELSLPQREEVKSITARASAEWIARLQKAVTALSPEGVATHTVFFTADAELKSFFEELLRTGEIATLDAKDRNVWYLDHTETREFVVWDSGVKKDAFLALEALFAQKTFM